MNDKLSPRKPPIRIRVPKRREPDIVPEYPETPLPKIDLSIPFYHKERFQKIAGLSGAIVGAVLYFIPGTQALGGILASVGTTAWGTAAQFHRIKERRAAGQNTWLDIVLSIIRKILATLREK